MKKIKLTRYITVALLVVVLGLAVFINQKNASKEDELQAERVMAEDAAASEAEHYYGEATYVSASSVDSANISDTTANATVDSNEYFASARLNRESSREKALEIIKESLNNASLTEKAKTEAALLVAQTAQRVEDEATIENLIIAKGFKDCMVYLDGENANVVVKSDGLTANQVIQIKEIVSKGTDVSGEIKIVEVK